MSDIVIRLEGISKRYRIGAKQEKYKTLRDTLTDAAVAPIRRLHSFFCGQPSTNVTHNDTIWALQDVSLTIQRGEVVGIIGSNGAGKSTLLKILSRITEPTHGFAKMRGRVSSLLEVGTGFHPELTGRENVYLNAAILGMKHTEIDRKFDEIVAFAEIEKFIDTPVKHYSSGMYLRLAFAVAAHLEPDILLVDEVLAVGDAAFQKKCLGKMQDVARQGRTILFVSHNMAALEHLCQKAIVLHEGKLLLSTGSKEAIDFYLHMTSREREASNSHIVDLSHAAGRPPGRPRLLKRLEFFSDDDKPLSGTLRMGASFKALVYFRLEKPTSSFDACLVFDNLYGQHVFVAHSLFEPEHRQGEFVGDQIFVCEIPSLTLVPGKYKLWITLAVPRGEEVDRVEDAAYLTVIESDYYGTGRAPWSGLFVLKQHWYLQ